MENMKYIWYISGVQFGIDDEVDHVPTFLGTKRLNYLTGGRGKIQNAATDNLNLYCIMDAL